MYDSCESGGTIMKPNRSLRLLTLVLAAALVSVAPAIAGADSAAVGSYPGCTPVCPETRPDVGGIDLFNIEGQPLRLHIWDRASVWDWNYFPATNKRSGPGSQNSYNFEANVLKIGLGYYLDGIATYAEVENPTLIGVPDQAIAPPPKGPAGFGGLYYLNHQNAVDSNYFLKQGWAEFGDRILKGLDIKAGRIEFLDGTEMMPEDPQLHWLVANEIQQRLIGNFVFPSDIGRSFDGGTVRYGTPAWNATVFYGVPTVGVFDLNGMDEISSIDVFYAALNAGPNQFWGNSVGRVFYIWYDDNRGIVPVDNQPAALAKANLSSIAIDTIGADFIHTWDVGPGIADFLVWGAYQFGSWGNQAQRAYSYVGALGYRFTDVAWKPWLRTQYTFGSGDSNPKNGVHGTFFQILPTPRIYALDPIYNMMNTMDLAGQLILNPLPNIEWRSDIDALWLASSQDLWYQGGGAYNNNFFGYVGHPSFGKSYLGTVVDSGVDYKVNNNLFLRFYGGHMFGGSVVGALYPDGRGETFAFAVAILTI